MVNWLNGLTIMRIAIPFIPIELELTARRRRDAYRVRLRTLLMIVAGATLMVYFCLPFSTADCVLMARYEWLANNEPKPDLTKDEVIRQIGPPASVGTPVPNTCVDYTWMAQFDRPFSHQTFELGLSIDPYTSLVAAWRLNKREYQGIELLWYRLGHLLEAIGF
jgi:hypothetical protein